MKTSAWMGRCTVVAMYSLDDYPHQWCTHWHEDADEANSCPWLPDDPELRLFIVYEYEFDPEASSPCDPHGLHPGECDRCLAVRCIHLNVPEECERCVSADQPGLDQTSTDGGEQPVLEEGIEEGVA